MKMILKDNTAVDILSFRYINDLVNKDSMGDINAKYVFVIDLTNIKNPQEFVDGLEEMFSDANLAEVIVKEGETTLVKLKLSKLVFVRFNGNEAGLTLDITIA